MPAFLMKDQPRSHIERSTLPSVGRWYAGSSITNGAGSPAKGLVFLRMIPDTMMEAIKKGMDPKEAYEKNIGTYGRFAEAAKVIDPRKE